MEPSTPDKEETLPDTATLWDLQAFEEEFDDLDNYGDDQAASVFDDRHWDHLDDDLDDDEAEDGERGLADEDAYFFDEMVPPYELERRGVEEDHLFDDTELEDWGSTRAARKVAREEYRFNIRKSRRGSHSSKTWKRASRNPWHRNRRWIAQWEKGVAARHERTLKPGTVRLEQLEWRHVPNWGMRAKVVEGHSVGEVTIPREHWVFRSNRSRPLDHELWELDALQERAWDERERMRDRVRELAALEPWEIDVFEIARERFAG